MGNLNLIERYVSEVGRNLPRRMRADVELELRSLLADSLEERQSDSDNQDVIIDLLEELGPPAAFAAQYLPEQKLIGPKLFPLFKMVLTIVLSVIAGIHLVLAIIAFFQGGIPDTVGQIIRFAVQRFVNFGESAIYVLGIITVIFAILEWFDVGDAAETEEAWSPNDLPEVEDRNQISYFDLIFGIVGTTLLILVINLIPDGFGSLDFIGGEWGVSVTEGFYTHVSWLTALWVGEIALKFYVLRHGHWRKLTRGIELALQIFAVFVLYRILDGPAVIAPEFVDSIVKNIILVVVVITVIDAIVKLYRLIVSSPDFVNLADDEGVNSKVGKSVG
ncbi:MAG: hypothetical protein AAGD96_34020 [Chloroflexota bacterium]